MARFKKQKIILPPTKAQQVFASKWKRNIVKKKRFSISFDQTDLLLNHNSINAIDPTLVGMILLHEATAGRNGVMPKTLYWGYGNIREELEKAAKIPSVANMEFVYFSYTAGVTVRQYQNLKKRFR